MAHKVQFWSDELKRDVEDSDLLDLKMHFPFTISNKLVEYRADSR